MIVKINTTIDLANGVVKDNMRGSDEFGHRILTSEERKALAQLMIKRWEEFSQKKVK